MVMSFEKDSRSKMNLKRKKRTICTVIVMMVTMVMLAGCGGSADAEAVSYEDIIGKYTELAESADDLSNYMVEEDINIELFSAVAELEGWNIYYTEKDIDNNGVDELLISGGYDTDETVNYLIYTMDENGAVDLFPDYEFGARAKFAIYEGGIISVEGSNSAEDSIYEYYKASGYVTSVELIDSAEAENVELVEMEFDWKQL